MIKILKQQRIPNIFVRLNRMRLEGLQAKVVTQDNMTKNVKVNVRVTEGEAL
jgi:hypothetical protein